jgi:putrescine transport system substrate-binding protein
MRHKTGLCFQSCTIILCLLILSCGSPDHPAVQPGRELNLYIWASYLDPSVIEQFKKETGVSVRTVTYPSQETLEAVLLAGHTQYDVVDVGGEMLEYMIRVGVIQQLDRSQLSNWKNLDQVVLDQLSRGDPGNRFAVPYSVGNDRDGDQRHQVEAGGPHRAARLVASDT